MKRLPYLLFSTVLLLSSNALAQTVYIEVSVTAGSSNFSFCTTSATVTLTNMGGGSLGTYSVSTPSNYVGGTKVIYQADLPHDWQGKIQASASRSGSGGSGCSAGISIPSQTITFNNNTCNSGNYHSGTSSVFEISLSYRIYTLIGNVAVDESYHNCGVSTVNLGLTVPQHPGTTFDWQVSKGAGIWHTFRSNAASSINATVDELNHSSFADSKYSERYVRAVGTNCPSSRTTSHVILDFLPPKPTVSVTRVHPKCYNSSDGAFQINITGPNPAYYVDFTIDVTKPGEHRQTELINKFTTEYAGFGFGTYEVIVMYKDDTDCPAIFTNQVLTNPTQLTASLQPSDYNDFQISCNGASDGSIQVNASGGTGAYSYQWTPSVSTSSFKNGLAVGSYSITVKDANDCPVTLNTTLTQPSAAPTVTISGETGGVTGYDLSCAAATDGKLVASGSSQVSGAISYQWTSGPASNTWPDLGAGTYTATMTDANGCTDSESKTLTVRPDINFSISQVSAIECRDQPDGELEVASASITNATEPYSYSWSSGETSSFIINKMAGTYSVTVTDAKGCKRSKSTTLDNPAGYSVTINPLSDYNGSSISCVGEDDGALGTIVKDLATNNTVTATHYAWFKDNSPYNSGASLSSISGLTAATYKAEITYGANCKAQSVFVLSDPVPVTPEISITSTSLHNGFHVSCPSATNGSLLAIATGGSGSMNYSWDTSPVTNGASLVGIGAGTYTVTATDANGCIGSFSKTINDPPVINPSISIETNYNGQAIKCHNAQDANLKASASGGAGGYTYLWDTGVTGADLNNVGAGTYTVTVADANSCTETKSQTLVNPTQVTGSISITSDYHGQAIKCYNDLNGVLLASGAGGAGSYTYAWNTGATSATLSAIGAGTYSVIIKDINQCSSLPVNQTLTNPVPVAADIAVTSDYHGAIISCDGAQDGSLAASATGGTGIFTYTWNTGDSGADLGGLPKGTYEVTATDQNGCFEKNDIVIDDPAPVTASITAISNYNGYGIKCSGDHNGFMEASGSGGTGAYSFVWQNTSETTYRLSDIGEGTYTVTITDVNGCHDNASADIVKPAELSFSATQKVDPKCFDGNDGTITVQATGGVGGYEYARDLPGWQTPSQFSGLRATQYTLKVKDANGCITSIQESLGQPTQITITFQDVEPAFCADPRGKATAVVTGGTGSNYAYEWRNAGNVLFDTDATIDNLNAGAYTLKVYDENNCIAGNAIGIVSTDGPTAEVEEMIPAKCSYSADGSATLRVTGNSPFTFAWQDGQTTIQGEDLPKGSYLVTITDTHGCTSVKQVDVTAPEELSINLVETTMPSCKGLSDGKLKVAAQGGTPVYMYSWNGVNGEERTGLATGYHTVKVTDANGCEAENTFPLDEPTLLELTLLSRQLPSCHGYCDGSIEVEASGSNGGYSYSWNVGRTEAKAMEICAADHTVTVTDAKGCVLERTYNLGQPEILQSRLLKSTRPSCHADCDGSLEIEAFGGNGGYTYLWTEGSSSSVIENICAGDHLVTITDSKGCQETNKIFVLNEPEPVQARVVKEQMPDCHGDCNGSIEV